MIHCNGGTTLGVGHVVRSFALAEEAVARGHLVSFTGDYQGAFAEGLLAGLPVSVQPAPRDLSSLARELEVDVVHVDSYAPLELDAGRALVSNVEDGPFGRRPADLTVDPNLGAEAAKRPDVPALLLLRGTRYAPLRCAVAALRGRAQIREVAGKVLVVMGGTDTHALSPRAVAALAATGLALRITVVAPETRHRDCRRAAAGSPGVQLELLSEVADLPARMVEQDLVISASGTSVWELCCLGVPMALVCAADNQVASYDRLVAAGAAVGLGVRLADLAVATQVLRQLLLDPSVRVDLASRASVIVDGRGAWRVVGAWEQLLSMPPEPATGRAVDTRPVTAADAELLRGWRNDPETRAASRNTDAVPFDAHVRWLEGMLARDDRLLLIGSDAAGDVGTVRWEQRGSNEWEVSITVAPERRGKGFARPLLAAGERALEARVRRPVLCLASVRTNNRASMSLFMKAGYLLEAPSDADGFVLYARQPAGL
jgi:spore coat polysaccharide biosynthesis predicted glycosyltransferase SpsG/ribosomal protein S18 acetylase RimI-like enzyme